MTRKKIANAMVTVGLMLMGIGMLGEIACKPGPFLTPPTGPGTPYPCGYYGVSCFPYDGTHTCCGEGDVCVKDGCDYMGIDHTFGAGDGEKKHTERFTER